MKICIVIPPTDRALTRDAHARYESLAAMAPEMGAAIMRATAAEIAGLDFEHDLYVFGEIRSAPALLLARRIREAGRATALDILDDDFATKFPPDDKESPVDFYLCRNDALADKLRAVVGAQARIFVAPDPAPAFDPYRLSHLLEFKHRRAHDSRTIGLLCILASDDDIGDLVRGASQLRTLMRDGWSTELTILADRATLGANGLAHLRQVPIPFVLREASSETERLEIARHFALYSPTPLPLPRALSALAGGCQILAPAGGEIADFVLDSPAALRTALTNDRLPLRRDTIPDLEKFLARSANLFEAVDAMRRGAESSAVRTPPPRRDIGIIHGAMSDMDAHRVALALSALSIRSPLCRDDADFDVKIDLDAGKLTILIDEKIVDTVAEEFRRPELLHHVARSSYIRLDAAPFMACFGSFAFWDLSRRATSIAAGPSLIGATLALCRMLFPQTEFHISGGPER